MFKIGIIGRPNVGKSTLFNRIVGKRIAITDDMPGVTRDRIEMPAEWIGKKFTMVDTAGYDLKEDIIKKEMQGQFLAAIDEADLLILLTDGKEGLHSLDEIVVSLLRERGKDFILVVNKIDTESKKIFANEFYALGVDNLHAISATHGHRVYELMDAISEYIPENHDEEDEKDDGNIKIAVIGRPNVGKSSIVNGWLNEERLIVTPIAGTTRDAVHTYFEYEDSKYVLIDTAGIRKKSVMFKDKIEKYGYYRSIDAIADADIAVAVLDSNEGVTERDVKVIAEAWEAGRPIVLVFNKWDLKEKGNDTAKDILDDVETKLQFLNNAPVIFTSAMTKKNLFKVFDAVQGLYERYTMRVATAEVNTVLDEAIARHQAPILHNNRRLKFYYMTQVSAKPPTFVVFVNYPDAVHFSYSRFITNILRDKFDLKRHTNKADIASKEKHKNGKYNTLKY